MPRASARVDVVLVPTSAEVGDAQLAAAWWQLGVQRGWWLEDGSAGAQADQCVQGGFARARIEHSPAPRLIANQLGGFRVRCRVCGANAVRDFSVGMGNWRKGEPREWRCTSCGTRQALEDAELTPPGAFAVVALHLMDAATAEVRPEVVSALAELGTPTTQIARRIG